MRKQRPLVTSLGTGETKTLPERDYERFITALRLSTSSVRFPVYSQRGVFIPKHETVPHSFKATALNSKYRPVHKPPIFIQNIQSRWLWSALQLCSCCPAGRLKAAEEKEEDVGGKTSDKSSQRLQNTKTPGVIHSHHPLGSSLALSNQRDAA